MNILQNEVNETDEEPEKVEFNNYRKSSRKICVFLFISRAAISFGCSEGGAGKGKEEREKGQRLGRRVSLITIALLGKLPLVSLFLHLFRETARFRTKRQVL